MGPEARVQGAGAVACVVTRAEMEEDERRVLPLAQAAEAHRIMKASEHFGKIVLRVTRDA